MSLSLSRREKQFFLNVATFRHGLFQTTLSRKFSSRGKLGANSTRILCRGSESILTAVGRSNEPRPCFSTRCRATWQKYTCIYIYITNPPSSRSHDINIPGLFPRIFTFHASIPLLHVITSYFPTHTFPSPLAISSEIFLDSLKSVHRVNFFLLLP